MTDKIACRTCGRDNFKNWREFAHHLQDNKKTHHTGQRWAARYILKQSELDRKLTKNNQYRTPITDAQREAKEDTQYEPSGNMNLVPVKCPRCSMGSRQMLEVEHTENPQAWRIENCFVVLCGGCK